MTMTYEEWRDKTSSQLIAEELGYDNPEDVPPTLMAEIQHRLAEMWIEYRSKDLV